MQTNENDMRSLKKNLMTRMDQIDDSTIKLAERIDLLETSRSRKNSPSHSRSNSFGSRDE
jgi:(p)ppGpp synthase/HD superfamily hydrolase